MSKTSTTTKAKARTAKAETAKKDAKPHSEGKPKRLSCIDAAAKVLAESEQPMSTKAMIEAMGAKKYWSSPGGQTPEATLYSAILTEIRKKGTESRFVKTDRGRFGLNAAAPKSATAKD